MPDTVKLASNLYYTTSGSSYTRWFWNNTNYYNDSVSPNNFSAFTAMSGDTGSIIGNPAFINASASDFRLAAGSPGRNNGQFTATTGFPATGIKDFAMNPRITGTLIDRGAYEHVE